MSSRGLTGGIQQIKCALRARLLDWIPAFAGMTEKATGMTEKATGMTEKATGMIEKATGMTKKVAGMIGEY